VGEASSRSHDCAVEGSPDDHVTLVLIHGATVSFCCGAKSGKDKGGWRVFLCVCEIKWHRAFSLNFLPLAWELDWLICLLNN